MQTEICGSQNTHFCSKVVRSHAQSILYEGGTVKLPPPRQQAVVVPKLKLQTVNTSPHKCIFIATMAPLISKVKHPFFSERGTEWTRVSYQGDLSNFLLLVPLANLASSFADSRARMKPSLVAAKSFSTLKSTSPQSTAIRRAISKPSKFSFVS